jgi:hypothetical protein
MVFGLWLAVLETPPRAWGRHRSSGRSPSSGRNTPTRVGKTLSFLYSIFIYQKHPHARGEDIHISVKLHHIRETPPRAWGRRRAGSAAWCYPRNTPTRVGKTCFDAAQSATAWKHPHARGEDASLTTFGFIMMETPPRAWGRLRVPGAMTKKHRNTPTRVGKTLKKLFNYDHS